jgi:XTP/dITP diphosphohydrolase
MDKILIGTRNLSKVQELRELLGLPVISLADLANELGQPPEVRETGRTYLENALLKARAYARWAGIPALADDSGLEVDALGGAPGVDTAYFAGPEGARGTQAEKIAKLLRALDGVPWERRGAVYRCVVAVAWPDGRAIAAEGGTRGVILDAPRGTGGFDYDPVFFYPPLGKTFAELTREEKNRVSHRARAVADLLRALKEARNGLVR